MAARCGQRTADGLWTVDAQRTYVAAATLESVRGQLPLLLSV